MRIIGRRVARRWCGEVGQWRKIARRLPRLRYRDEGAAKRVGQDRAGRVRLEISDEPVCYPVRRAVHAGARITCCSTASPTKMRTGSDITVQIDAARKLDRVRRYEPPHRGIVVRLAVVMQPGLRILLLPLKPWALARHDAERLRWRGGSNFAFRSISISPCPR